MSEVQDARFTAAVARCSSTKPRRNKALGLHDLTVHGERALNGFLRREAGDKFLVDELEKAARTFHPEWNYSIAPRPSNMEL
jgi:hypothetical protein